MSIDEKNGKLAFVCDVCSARFEVDDKPGSRPDFSAFCAAAKKRGWHTREQLDGKWHTACPDCATDDWKLWNWK
jgi:hypothetical protein